MMKKVKTKSAFETRAHRIISRKSGEIIQMPDEDYEEVKDLVEILEDPSPELAAGLKANVSDEIGMKDGLKKGRK
jgi:hypothetical protein